jgi:hypothetical protein
MENEERDLLRVGRYGSEVGLGFAGGLFLLSQKTAAGVAAALIAACEADDGDGGLERRQPSDRTPSPACAPGAGLGQHR